MRAIVVGGGVLGLCLARECSLRGADVTVLERHGPDATDAGVASLAALGVLNVPKWGVSPWRRLLALGYEFYPALARALRDETGSDIGLEQRGALHVLEDMPASEDREKAERVYGRGGFRLEWLDAAGLSRQMPWLSPRFRAALFLPQECVVSPPDLLATLRCSLAARGATLRYGVGSVRLDPRRCAVTMPDGRSLAADLVFIATGSWLASALPPALWSSAPVEPVRGQAIELRLRRPRGPTVHFVSSRDDCGYYYLSHGDDRVWVGSTVEEAGHDGRVTLPAARELLAVAAEVDPDVRAGDVRRHWAGLRPKAMRLGGPFLDRLPGREDVWIAVGHYRSGILAGPLSAALLARRVFEPESLSDIEREVLAGFPVLPPDAPGP